MKLSRPRFRPFSALSCCALLCLLATGAAPRPDALIHVAAGEEPETVLLVEKASQRLFVYQSHAGRLELLRTLPCTTGRADGDKRVEGDLKTPEGVYWFERYIPGRSLPPLYGAGALTMDYPNDFDRLDGKTGSGIWMHGVETDDRVHVSRDTRGCVALRNSDFDDLLPLISLGRTPIVVVESIQHLGGEELSRQAEELHLLLDDWRSAWESKDLPRYLSHYDELFRAPGHRERGSWARHKQQLAGRYAGIRVGIDDVTILREKDRVWLTFRQEYASDGHRDVGLKTLGLLDRGRDGFRIVSERWQPLDDDFMLIDPGAIEAMAPTLLASLYPDAAGAPAASPRPSTRAQDSAAARSPRAPAASPEPAQAVSDWGPPPGLVDPTQAGAEAKEVRVPEEVALAMEAAVPQEVAVGAVSKEATETKEPAVAAVATRRPPAPDESATTGGTPPPDLSPRILDARLLPEASGRGVYRLLAPFARLSPVGLRLQVQLLNRNPSRPRAGVLSWTAELPGLDPVLPEPARRPLVTRQGELLEIELPQPLEPGVVLVHVVVDDGSGRAALRQSIRIDVPPEESAP